MARYTVRFDREAEGDLIGIRDYIAEARDREFAAEFVDRIVSHCENSANFHIAERNEMRFSPACERLVGAEQ